MASHGESAVNFERSDGLAMLPQGALSQLIGIAAQHEYATR